MTEDGTDPFFSIFHPASYCLRITQYIKKSSAFILYTLAVKNLICTGIASYCHMNLLFKSFLQILLAVFIIDARIVSSNLPQPLRFRTVTSVGTHTLSLSASMEIVSSSI